MLEGLLPTGESYEATGWIPTATIHKGTPVPKGFVGSIRESEKVECSSVRYAKHHLLKTSVSSSGEPSRKSRREAGEASLSKTSRRSFGK